MTKVDIHNIVYLDNLYIVKEYERITGAKAPVKYSKTTDVNVGINFGAKLGASLKETFEYPINTYEMFFNIIENLEKKETIKLDENTLSDLPDFFWLEGVFGLSSIGDSEERQNLFCVSQNLNMIFLATNDVYFSSGYDQLLTISKATYRYAIKAKILLKFLGKTPNFNIASPMVVIKTGNCKYDDKGIII